MNSPKDVIAEREINKQIGKPASAFVEKTRGSSPSQPEAANPNQLLLEIHEQIQSTDRDNSKRIESFSRDAKSSAAAAAATAGSSSSKTFKIMGNVRPLPIAALMGDVNPIAVPETDPQEGDHDEGGGEWE